MRKDDQRKVSVKRFRMIINMGMTAALLCLMTYSLIGEMTHEIVGTAMIVLFTIHHILNRRWFSALAKGRCTAFRVFQTGLVFALILSVLASAVSGIMLSEHLYTFLHISKGASIGILGLIPASLLGIASPLCMYGTVPLAASISKSGMRDEWLAAFMMTSVLLNPQLIIYSAALGATALAIRIVSSFLCGIAAGLLVRIFFKDVEFFNFSGFDEPKSRDTDPNMFIRLIKNIGRNIKTTGPMFVLGIFLSALFQRYVPQALMVDFFGGNEAWGVLMAATIGVPLYACGGGTIPLIQQWLMDGMSMGSAAAFMITCPATKITNLGALKIIFGVRRFVLYVVFIMLYSMLTGVVVNIIA